MEQNLLTTLNKLSLTPNVSFFRGRITEDFVTRAIFDVGKQVLTGENDASCDLTFVCSNGKIRAHQVKPNNYNQVSGLRILKAFIKVAISTHFRRGPLFLTQVVHFDLILIFLRLFKTF